MAHPYAPEEPEPVASRLLFASNKQPAFDLSKELRAKLLEGARLIQFMIGGVDFIPLGELPVATNGGGYAESMAEHALAVALAAAPKPKIPQTRPASMRAKRLVLEHENVKRGQF